MKKMTRKLALGMAAVLLAGSLSACSANTGDGVAKYGNEVISTEEAEFWLRYEQWTTEAYYWDVYTSMMGVENMWDIAYSENQTMGQYVKQNVMAQVLQTRVLLDHAAEYQVAELTDDQKEACKTAIDSFLEAYPAFQDQVSADTEAMYSYMEKNALANLVAKAIKDAADVTVEEDAYKKYGIKSVKVNAPEESTEETEAAETEAANTEETAEAAGPEGMELAGEILKAVSAGEDMDTVVEQYGLTAYDSSFLLTGETSEDVRYNASKDLKVGEANLVEADDGGWYVVVRTSDYDEEASETQKENLIEEKQTQAFDETYTKWADAAPKFTVNEKVWETIAITGKIYEAPESETEVNESETVESVTAETAADESDAAETEAPDREAVESEVAE